jgi:NAD(P)-dependent dehydrogenase (short-subunit alcohol dehydrogenase family)
MINPMDLTDRAFLVTGASSGTGLATFLLADTSRWVTGSTVVVDGGYMTQ